MSSHKREMTTKVVTRAELLMNRYFRENYINYPSKLTTKWLTEHGFSDRNDFIQTMKPIYKVDKTSKREFTDTMIAYAFNKGKNIKKNLEGVYNKAVNKLEQKAVKNDIKNIVYNKEDKQVLRGAARFINYSFDKTKNYWSSHLSLRI